MWTLLDINECSLFILYISKLNEDGIILLKVYTQQFQYCYSIVYPLWYYGNIEIEDDEIFF